MLGSRCTISSKVNKSIFSGSKDGVIAIHCNHGKGRTGTGIISFMILIGYIDSAEVCLKLYNNKRFSA